MTTNHWNNLKNPAVKRIMREAVELKEPTYEFAAWPMETNIFEWHFTFRGPSETDFEGGIYHGKIILPPDYPMRPPSIIMLTPNGRFEVSKKICLSVSAHHPEQWRPCWGVRSIVLAISGFLPTPAAGALESKEVSSDARKALAKKSTSWKCPECGRVNHESLKPEPEEPSSMNVQSTDKSYSDISFTIEHTSGMTTDPVTSSLLDSGESMKPNEVIKFDETVSLSSEAARRENNEIPGSKPGTQSNGLTDDAQVPLKHKRALQRIALTILFLGFLQIFLIVRRLSRSPLDDS